MKNLKLSCGIMAIAGLFGAAPMPASGDAAQKLEDTQTKIYELLDKDITTVKFNRDSAVLSDSEKSSLRSLVEAAKANKNIDRFIVAAWSDREYPASKDQKLSKTERDLAKNRMDTIQAFLKDVGAKDVDTYSFAEHPSWLARVFNTEQAQIKGAGKVKDEEERIVADIGKRLRDKGGPGTGVVVVKTKEEAAAH